MHEDDLKQNIARMEAELAAMKETLSKRERNWPEKITAGMLFLHKDGDVYMTRMTTTPTDVDLVLVVARKYSAGMYFMQGKCFNGKEHEFTYIGLAADHLRIV